MADCWLPSALSPQKRSIRSTLSNECFLTLQLNNPTKKTGRARSRSYREQPLSECCLAPFVQALARLHTSQIEFNPLEEGTTTWFHVCIGQTPEVEAQIQIVEKKRDFFRAVCTVQRAALGSFACYACQEERGFGRCLALRKTSEQSARVEQSKQVDRGESSTQRTAVLSRVARCLSTASSTSTTTTLLLYYLVTLSALQVSLHRILHPSPSSPRLVHQTVVYARF